MKGDGDRVELGSLDPQHELDHRFGTIHVPRFVLGHAEYVLLDTLRVDEAHDAVWFARTGLFGLLGFERASGAIVQVVGGHPPGDAIGSSMRVSSTVEEFSAVAEFVRSWWLSLDGGVPSAEVDRLHDALARGRFSSMADTGAHCSVT